MTALLNELGQSVEAAMKCVQACSAVRDIYARLQDQIDQRKPKCEASGKCCNFESYGHRLYVTTLELAAFKNDLKAAVTVARKARHPSLFENRQSSTTFSLPMLSQSQSDPSQDATVSACCPLQDGKRCSVHDVRPFGCRIFFCDPAATDWQQRQYELFHIELKQLHERFKIPYLYVEWRTALAALGIARHF